MTKKIEYNMSSQIESIKKAWIAAPLLLWYLEIESSGKLAKTAL